MPFSDPCGVITLTTDFGHKGPFVGVMKGQIYRRFPAARIVDLGHENLAHWPAEAGFWLARSIQYFPPGTVHVAVVDPGVGTSREIALVITQGQLLMAPDNGLLAPCFTRDPAAELRHLDIAGLSRFGIGRASATFHGRDVFAPLAAEIASGRHRPEELGPRVAELVPGWVEDPELSNGVVSGIVMTTDSFGNLITNIDAAQLGQLVTPRVYAANQVLSLRRTYGDVAPGQYLALINSFGVLEIALAEGSAAEGLGLSRGAPVVVRDVARLG
jgi:S-adenosylmethionine hydrolase